MERFNFVKNGVLRLPPGFRFHPTDQELVHQYLRRKVYDCPLPASIIPDFDVCRSDPWDLPGDCGQERYFFSTKEAKYPNGNRANRATVSGFWKATGIDKPVLAAGNKNQNQVVGMKKTLVFYRGKPPRGSKTDWIMHEYRLASTDNNPSHGKQGGVDAVARGNWVICRIFLKRRNDGPMIDTFNTRINNNINCNNRPNNLNANHNDENNQGSKFRNDRPILYDFMGSGGDDDKSRCHGIDIRRMASVVPTVSSSSGSAGSSGVTDVSSLSEESSSSNNVFPISQGSRFRF